MTDRNPHAPLTPAVFHVLLALEDEPSHGYAIMKRVERDSTLTMGPGTVYGSLRRLAEAGWVREDESVSEEDARRGKIFSLTDAGRAALAAEAARITRLAHMEVVRRLAPEGNR